MTFALFFTTFVGIALSSVSWRDRYFQAKYAILYMARHKVSSGAYLFCQDLFGRQSSPSLRFWCQQ